MFKAGGADRDPEVLQVRHDSAFALHAETLLTDDVLALNGIQHLHLTRIAALRHLFRGTATAALTILDAALRAGLSVSVDPNLRLNLWPDADEMRGIVNTVAARATLVMPGLAEGRLLTGASEADDITVLPTRRGVREVVLKLGADGARAWTAGGETARSRSFAITPIDTVGAGDRFAAGYLVGLLTGVGLQQRLDRRRGWCTRHDPARRQLPCRHAPKSTNC